MEKPKLGFWGIWNISFGFFGIQIAFALQGANISRIFQTLGADMATLPALWLAGPITGLLVQPLVGHFSDRTWTKLGRRRPYFLIGAILTTGALFIMPNSPVLWVAAVMLWVLDAAINISMEPFRAFVGDMLPSKQRTRGFAMQTIFIGTGAFLGSIAPLALTQLGVANTADAGVIPDSVKWSFYIGGVALFLAVGWTIVTSREYSPEQMAQFEEEPSLFRSDAEIAGVEPPSAGSFFRVGLAVLAIGAITSFAVFHYHGAATLYVLTGGVTALGVGLLVHAGLTQAAKARGAETENFFSEIMNDMTTMPVVMQRLAVVQFFSWFALFIMWVYATPAITSHLYGTSDTTSAAYNDGANWVGVLFAVYNIVAAIYAFILPLIAKAIGKRGAHALGLVVGGLALASFYVVPTPELLVVSMVGVGIAWATILTMPYAILSDAVPSHKMGIYMGIFNFFIVIPQIVVGGLMGPVLVTFLGGQAIYTFLIAGASLVIGAACTSFVQARSSTAQAAPAE